MPGYKRQVAVIAGVVKARRLAGGIFRRPAAFHAFVFMTAEAGFQFAALLGGLHVCGQAGTGDQIGAFALEIQQADAARGGGNGGDDAAEKFFRRFGRRVGLVQVARGLVEHFQVAVLAGEVLRLTGDQPFEVGIERFQVRAHLVETFADLGKFLNIAGRDGNAEPTATDGLYAVEQGYQRADNP